ncbi:thiol:disulfide interchange protein DsbA/DsbL [Shewanella schlegeliana]|uniref:Thiol:disulfide interchange protein n=1 Tax=Shewanella schlegeliana TaxID=190308 RepID=A0ABS1T1Y9_9GAMM|nr:thiol:disulfide interchange protein DsbA/DsbL [Shewanella schlegeliana]MBL4914821.1 thiol:disulfide interchange protein DsbA/DsbL [Shewanella schlegeliana]MCL1110488.1 thiol:disulfide interchange protein DsbA/DsbL [Shewanella schlegeliana]GIU27441.1 thiol:disulfide interchange protein DsbA [Shewanella schlegeliana]
MKKRLVSLFLAFVMVACSEPSNLDADGNLVEGFVEGVHYRTLAAPIPANSDNISVTEFFWYGCPHCELFEKPLHGGISTMGDDVSLVQSPAVWNEAMKLHAKVFFIVQQMPGKQQIHSALFREIMDLREVTELKQQQALLADFLSGYGLTQQEFNEKLNSADINSKLEQAMQLMSSAEIQGTPTILVNGRYVVLNESASSAEQVMEIASYLVELERAKFANP